MEPTISWGDIDNEKKKKTHKYLHIVKKTQNVITVSGIVCGGMLQL